MTTSSVGSAPAIPSERSTARAGFAAAGSATAPLIRRSAWTKKPSIGDPFTARQFDWLNQVIADADLPAAAFKLAYVISRHINRGQGYAWPGQPTLANAIGVTVRTVRDLIDRLVAGGHLAVEEHRGRHQTNWYRPVSKGKPASAFDDEKEEAGFRISIEEMREPASAFARQKGKFETQKAEISCTKTGSRLPTNPFKNPLMNPGGSSNIEQEGEGFWIRCESPQGDAWQSYWRATGQREPIRSGRTGCYLKKLPTEYPPDAVA